MKKYDKYKDSGIEWIGEIPETWKIGKLKLLCEVITDGSHYSPPSLDKGKRYLSVKDIGYNEIKFEDCKYISTEEFTLLERNGCRPHTDDILLTKDGTIGRAAKVGNDNDFVVLSSLGIIRSNKARVNPDFLREYLVSDLNVNQMLSLIQGSALTRITITIIKNLIVPIPPLPEQTAIANYLDHKTAQIDTLIAKKENLIKLLQEERTAIINQAVTKGLNPNAPMKNSGIEWLGEIPAHWEVKRVKQFTDKIGSGVTPRGGAEVYLEEGIPLFRSQNIYFEGFKLGNIAFISKDIHDSMKNSQVIKGDVLLNITGGSIGRCYYFTNEYEEANVNQHVCIMRPNKLIQTEYLHFLFGSDIGQLQIDSCQGGGNREAVNFEQIKNFAFGLPNCEEQILIIKAVNERRNKIQIIIIKAEKEIDLLKEYKTALISEVVTGKIDVRDEVIENPN